MTAGNSAGAGGGASSADILGSAALRQAEALALRVTTVEHRVEDLAVLSDKVADLAAAVAVATGQQEDTAHTRPIPWGDLDADDQVTELERLHSWVEDHVKARYMLALLLPACWPAHPTVVEELRALRWAWHSAYTDPRRRGDDPADWHARHWPGFLARLHDRRWPIIPPPCLQGGTGHETEPTCPPADPEILTDALDQLRRRAATTSGDPPGDGPATP